MHSLLIGLAYGSLHFVTFDGTNYTFKGLGVFVIVRLSSSKGSNVFTLQGETGVLELNGQSRQVPALVRLAAYHQAFGKVQIIFLNDVISFGVNSGLGCLFRLHKRKKNLDLHSSLIMSFFSCVICSSTYCPYLHASVLVCKAFGLFCCRWNGEALCMKRNSLY